MPLLVYDELGLLIKWSGLLAQMMLTLYFLKSRKSSVQGFLTASTETTLRTLAVSADITNPGFWL